MDDNSIRRPAPQKTSAPEGGKAGKQATKKRKHIRSSGSLVRVSDQVYREYYRMRRRERYQEERDRKKGVASLDAMGYNTLLYSKKDYTKSEIEEAVMEKWCWDILFDELMELSEWDKKLIGLLYFARATLNEAADAMGCSRGKVISHRNKVLFQVRNRFNREGVYECPV